MTGKNGFVEHSFGMEGAENRIQQILDDASLALVISVGHRTGLFDALFGSPPLMEHEIAERSGLSEHYVSVWVRAMTLAELITYDDLTRRYRLHPEFGALLSRAAGQDNAAPLMQWFGLLGSVEDAVVDAFQRGGSVPVPPRQRLSEIRSESNAVGSGAGLFEFLLRFVPDTPLGDEAPRTDGPRGEAFSVR